MSNDMSAENNPGMGGEGQPQESFTNQSAFGQTPQEVQPAQNPNPKFQLAAEGGPSFNPHGGTQYDARLGGEIAGKPPIPGSSPTPERQPTPKGGHGLRNAAIGLGATFAAGAIAAASILGIDRMRSSNEDPETGGVGGTATQVDPEKTHTTTTTQQPETPTPTPTETATPTPTEVTEPEGSRGNVESIDQLNIPEAQKEAINKMLEMDGGATPQIIIEKNGIVVIVAIANNMIKMESGYQCADFIDTTRTCGTVNDVRLRTDEVEMFKEELGVDNFDVQDEYSKAFLNAAYEAWMSQSGNDSLTFEQFLSSRNVQSFDFQRRARNVFTGAVGIASANDKSPVVILISDKQEPHTVEFSQASASDPLEGNGVIGERIWMANIGSIGSRDAASAVREDFALDSAIAYAIAQWSDVQNLSGSSDAIRSGHIASLTPTWREIIRFSIPIQKADHWIGLSKVKGIPSSN